MSSTSENIDLNNEQGSEEMDLLTTSPSIGQNTEQKTDSVNSVDEYQIELADDVELKNLMAQLNPQAIKDIMTIEKGVEHYFLFHQSHLALVRPDQMKYLSNDDIKTLESKKAFIRFEYLLIDELTGKLELKFVLIRPASLLYEQVKKIKQGCIRGSVIALLKFIHLRDKKLLEFEKQGILGKHVSDAYIKVDENGQSLSPDIREDLNKLIKNLNTISFEYMIEKDFSPCKELMQGILNWLTATHSELIKILPEKSDDSKEAFLAIESRGTQPILFSITNEMHLITPDTMSLVEMNNNKVQNLNSEIEWIHVLYVQLARKMLLNVLPTNKKDWIDTKGITQDKKYLEELKSIQSFQDSDWPNAPELILGLEVIINKIKLLKNLRREFLLQNVAEDSLNRLNMAFEPVLFNLEQFEVPESVSEVFNKEELFEAVIEKINKRDDVLISPERRSKKNKDSQGMYLIYASNLSQSFIDNKDRRNFLHLMARENGYDKGIYSFLREVSDASDSKAIVDGQIEFSRSIREWEDDIEKERLKNEIASLSFFERLVRFFRGLFGLGDQTRRNEDSENKKKNKKEKKERIRGKKGNIIKGRMREKSIKIPVNIQKAVDYVDRNNHGLIWLDQVMMALASTKFSDDHIGDMLHYDEENRYTEVRSLVSIRRVFILNDSELDDDWIEKTVDYLENVSHSGPEHEAMLEYLRR